MPKFHFMGVKAWNNPKKFYTLQTEGKRHRGDAKSSLSQGLPWPLYEGLILYIFLTQFWILAVEQPSKGKHCWMISLKNATRFVASVIQHPGATVWMGDAASTKSFSVCFQSRKGSFQEGRKYFGIIQKLLCFSKGCQENVGLRKEEQRFIQREDAPSPRDQKTKSFGQKPSRFPSIVGREGPQEEVDSYHSILLGKVNFQAFHPFACLPHHQPVCTQLAISLFFFNCATPKMVFCQVKSQPSD